MAMTGYRCEAGRLEVTSHMRDDFSRKGFVLVKNLFNTEELQKIRGALESEGVVEKYAMNISDGSERKSLMCLWNQPGDDVTGMVARCQRVAGTCEKLLGGEVYHYHSKLMMKEARTGGRFVWHQDYGYWYKYTCLFPDMMTAFVAVDSCNQQNGCLQVLEGSHRCGRIDHCPVSGQMGADVERVEQLKERCPHRHVTMEAGDTLFFHANLLHASSGNDSDQRRWALLCAYNRDSNGPAVPHHHSSYVKLNKVADSAVLECQVTWDLNSKSFLTQEIRDAIWREKTQREAAAATTRGAV